MNNIALVFPGQGSQYVGMGKAFFEDYSLVRNIFEEASDYLRIDIKKLCFEGSMEELTKTENTQPAILTTSYAMFKVYMMEIGIKPKCSAGHSLGELTALTCAGSIKFQDALKIAIQRGKFMQQAVAPGLGAMSAVSGVDINLVQEECKKHNRENEIVVVANYNCINQVVISGHKKSVNLVNEKLKGIGAKVVNLNVSAPFHSPLMQSASNKLKAELIKYSYDKMEWPVLANINALPYENANLITEKLSLQVVKPVRWIDIMKYFKVNDIESVIEIGPKTVLRDLIKKDNRELIAFSYDKKEDVKILNRDVLKKVLPQPGEMITKCLAVAICTKNRNWNDDEYQKGVIEPYNSIQQLMKELEFTNKEPTLDQAKEAIMMLYSVFKTKKVPLDEQIKRLELLLAETGMKELMNDLILHSILP